MKVETAIRYLSNIKPAAEDICELYKVSLLNRPVDNPDRIKRMYDGSNLIVSAWDGERLVGVLRAWTDGACDGYISDLAINPEYQRFGIGSSLLKRARTIAGPEVQFVLRASKIATNYYDHIGWRKIENGWFYPRVA